MKALLCILGVLVAIVCVNCEISEEMKQKFKECRTEMGLPDKKSEGLPNIDDPKIKCFHACLMKKTGKMVDGKIVPEKVIEHFMKKNPDDSVKEKITACATTANAQTDECEVAAAMHKCIMEKIGMPHH